MRTIRASDEGPASLRLPTRRGLVALLLLAACSGEDASQFQKEDRLTRGIAGRVRTGSGFGAGAIVQLLEKTTSTGATFAPLTAVTDASGFYLFDSAALRYDLSVKSGADLVLYRGLANRYVEPSLSDELPLAGWESSVEVLPDAPLEPEHRLAVFANGEDVVGAFPGSTGDTLVRHLRYSQPATLHVVAYDASLGMRGASRYGRAEVLLRAQQRVPVRVRLESLRAPVPLTTLGEVPANFSVTRAEVLVDFGIRADAKSIAEIQLASPVSVARIPFARYAVRVVARRGDAISDSGVTFFAPDAVEVRVSLPEPLFSQLPPSPDLGVSSHRAGVFEHTISGAAGASRVRIINTSAVLMEDDVRLAGAPQSKDLFWTLRFWPGLQFVDQLTGPDARVFGASATSVPRALPAP